MTELEAKILAAATHINGRPVGRGDSPPPAAKRKRKPQVVTTGGRPRWAFVLHPACRVISEANSRGHWAAGDGRRKAQKQAVLDAWHVSPFALIRAGLPSCLPAVVTLTHIGPRMDEGDNLNRAFKAVRDEVARLIGVDDGDDRVQWKYEQRTGAPGVVITIEGK